MLQCVLCRSHTNEVATVNRLILKLMKRAKPSVTEESLFCKECRRRAKQQLRRFVEKNARDGGLQISQRKGSHSELPSMSTLTSSQSSRDEWDNMVYQRSLLSANRSRGVQLTRENRLRLSQSQRDLPENNGVTPRRGNHQRQTDDDQTTTTGNATTTSTSQDSSISRSSNRCSIQSNADDDDIFIHPEDPLPGVAPYIRRVPLPEIQFAPEDEVAIYSQRTTGG